MEHYPTPPRRRLHGDYVNDAEGGDALFWCAFCGGPHEPAHFQTCQSDRARAEGIPTHVYHRRRLREEARGPVWGERKAHDVANVITGGPFRTLTDPMRGHHALTEIMRHKAAGGPGEHVAAAGLLYRRALAMARAISLDEPDGVDVTAVANTIARLAAGTLREEARSADLARMQSEIASMAQTVGGPRLPTWDPIGES